MDISIILEKKLFAVQNGLADSRVASYYTMLQGAFKSCNFESGATWKHVHQSWYYPWPFVQIHIGKKAASMKCQDISSRHVWCCSENSSARKRGTNMRENNFYFLFLSYIEHQMGEQNISTKNKVVKCDGTFWHCHRCSKNDRVVQAVSYLKNLNLHHW